MAIDPSAKRVTRRLGAAADKWREVNPELARTLDALGIRTEDYELGMRGSGEPYVVQSDSTASAEVRNGT